MGQTSQDTKSRPDTSKAPSAVGRDGKPCKMCTAFRQWNPTSSSSARTGTREDCPPDVQHLGRATWTFLHTTAAYYPENPTPEQRTGMLGLLRALPILYPCSHCASHLAENMKDHPPDVSGRAGLSWWLCQRHNEVNELLGRAKFDCTKTDERWKDGPSNGSCD